MCVVMLLKTNSKIGTTKPTDATKGIYKLGDAL